MGQASEPSSDRDMMGFDRAMNMATIIDAYDEFTCTSTATDRMKLHEKLLQAVVRQMHIDGTRDTAYVRALVTQAANPRWRGEPLKVKRVKA